MLKRSLGGISSEKRKGRKKKVRPKNMFSNRMGTTQAIGCSFSTWEFSTRVTRTNLILGKRIEGKFIYLVPSVPQFLLSFPFLRDNAHQTQTKTQTSYPKEGYFPLPPISEVWQVK